MKKQQTEINLKWISGAIEKSKITASNYQNAIKNFSEIFEKSSDCIVLPLFEEQIKEHHVTQICAKVSNTIVNGQIDALIKRGDFSAKCGETFLLSSFEESEKYFKRVLLVGLGQKAKLTHTKYRTTLASAIHLINKKLFDHVDIVLPALQKITIEQTIQSTIEIIGTVSYRFTHTKSKSILKEEPHLFKTINLLLNDHEDKLDQKHLNQVAKQASCLVLGMNLTRDLGNLAPNLLYPEKMAEKARELATDFKTKIKCEVLGESQMRALGMNSLLAVAQGSDKEAQLIVLEYMNGDSKQAPVVLVGKGVTFDSGGISLKPGEGMDEMKYDMCGAGSVLGAVKAIAEMDLKTNVVAIMPCVENMPSGKATRPGDIVSSMSGQTIEILNTDAEGRLILCDALTYAEKYNPKAVVDIATLTGAIIISLGNIPTGLFANDQKLADAIKKAADITDDRVWQLPIWEEYHSLLDSNFADIANIGGRAGGSITAACFLSKFTQKYPWAHLDIAGTAWKSGKEKGATGRPVSLLVELLKSYH